MLKTLFEENELEQPPMTLGKDLLSWIRQAAEMLDTRFIDESPMLSDDKKRFSQLCGGALPQEINWFYEHATPFIYMGAGFQVWREHIEIAYRRFREASYQHGVVNKAELEKQINSAPLLLPLELSHKGTALAFLDTQQGLAIIDGNIGPKLGRPMAIGLRNYLVQRVVVEILWCDKGYEDYAQALGDPWAQEAGGWPEIDAPNHPLIDAYEEEYWLDNSDTR